MANSSEIKIWRYIDLVKFVDMLATESLFFTCPFEFKDPYEGFLPRSHIIAYSQAIAPMIQDIIHIKNQIADQVPSSSIALFDAKIDNLSLLEASRKARRKFGVSCWHKSEYESEAMWKLYSPSGAGIAIESTIGQLEISLGSRKDLIIDSVRYSDFEKDPIEKGHKHYGLFIKRKSFEYENELRATIFLPEEGTGVHIKCNLNVLITNIHISPFSKPYFKNAIESLCLDRIHRLDKPVIQSELFRDPNYGINIKEIMSEST